MKKINRLFFPIIKLMIKLCPLSTIIFFKLFVNINSYNLRKVRSLALREQTARLIKLMNNVNFRNNILVKADSNIYIESAKIFLNTKGTDRYFKIADEIGNQGYSMWQFLEQKHISIQTMIDIGANYGEISLFFAYKYPSAKIIAIEPSPENLTILKENFINQFFNTSNIIVIPEAISDHKGFIKITQGLNSENSIISTKNSFTTQKAKTFVEIECTTLDEIINRMNLKVIDFIKIDIEGAEPLLIDSLRDNAYRIKAVLIELGHKNTVESYLELMKTMFDAGYHCYKHERNHKSYTCHELHDEYLVMRSHGKEVNDYWFLK